jgi:hypothetical protein
MPTLFYVHGNGLDSQEAMVECWQMYRHVARCPGQNRLVLWSWPSERVVSGLRIGKVAVDNLRIKLEYAERQGFYLARLVRQMSFHQPVTLCGHSYGAVTSSVALHLLGGGRLKGQALSSDPLATQANLRGALVAAAFDCDWIYPGHRYGCAFSAAEQVYVSRNPWDSAVRLWPMISYRGCPALGITGVSCARLKEHDWKLVQQELCPVCRRQHRISAILRDECFIAAVCRFAFASGLEQRECFIPPDLLDLLRQS